MNTYSTAEKERNARAFALQAQGRAAVKPTGQAQRSSMDRVIRELMKYADSRRKVYKIML